MEDFEQLLQEHQVTIRLVIYKLHLYKDLEQFEQIAAVALWQAYERYTGPANEFSAYAYTSIRYALLAELKIQNRYEQHHVLMDETNTLELLLHEKSFTMAEDRSELLQHVTPREQWLLDALYVKQYSYEQLASLLHISVDGVKKRRQRAINTLRSAIRKNQPPHER